MASRGWIRRDPRAARATAGPVLLSALAVLGLVVAAVGIVHARQDDHVRATGVHAEATILARAHSVRAADRLRVAFATADGRVVDRRVAVGDVASYPRGVPVPVVYDPAHPTHLVLVHGEESRLVRPLVFGGVVSLVALGALLVPASRRRRGLQVSVRGSRARVFLGVTVIAAVVILASGIAPTPVLGAAPTCPSPPRPAAGPASLGDDSLGAALVADGLTPSLGEPLPLGGVTSVVYGGDPTAATELAADGFTGAWYLQQQLGGHPVQAYAVQLRDPTAARHFEAERLLRVCQGAGLATYASGAPASDGTYTRGVQPQNRIAILRGSRIYYLVERGDPTHGPRDLRAAARRLAAAAR